MKNCHRWMLACVAVAVILFVVLPRFGVAIAGASLIVPLLMVGCCVLPMLFMMRSDRGNEGSCCAKKEPKNEQENKGVDKNVKSGSGSCH